MQTRPGATQIHRGDELDNCKRKRPSEVQSIILTIGYELRSVPRRPRPIWKGGAYVPEDLKIAVNTPVVWKNTGKTLHDVHTVVGDAHDKNDVHLPPGVTPFESGFIMPGQTFKDRLIVPGQYTYICILHEKNGAIGHIDATR